MIQETKLTFTLSQDEIETAFYDFFVQKFKSNCINAPFMPSQIKIDTPNLEVSLTINSQSNL